MKLVTCNSHCLCVIILLEIHRQGRPVSSELAHDSYLCYWCYKCNTHTYVTSDKGTWQSIIVFSQYNTYTCNSVLYQVFLSLTFLRFSTFAHRAGGQSLFEAWYPAWASSGSTMLYASAKLWPSGSAPFREGLLPPLGWLVASRGGATSLASCRKPPVGH